MEKQKVKVEFDFGEPMDINAIEMFIEEVPPVGRLINPWGGDLFEVKKVTEFWNSSMGTNNGVLIVVSLSKVNVKTRNAIILPSEITSKVKVVKVWKQNQNSLTLDKEYEVEEVIEHNYSENKEIVITDDKGVKKKYNFDNSQFIYI